MIGVQLLVEVKCITSHKPRLKIVLKISFFFVLKKVKKNQPTRSLQHAAKSKLKVSDSHALCHSSNFHQMNITKSQLTKKSGGMPAIVCATQSQTLHQVWMIKS